MISQKTKPTQLIENQHYFLVLAFLALCFLYFKIFPKERKKEIRKKWEEAGFPKGGGLGIKKKKKNSVTDERILSGISSGKNFRIMTYTKSRR